MPKTLYDKIWEDHLVHHQSDGTSLLYVDRHLVHEVTSPQAFEGLRIQKRKVRKPEFTLAVADHNVPTTDRSKGISDKESKIQVDTLRTNCKEFGIPLFDMNSGIAKRTPQNAAPNKPQTADEPMVVMRMNSASSPYMSDG